MSESIEDLRKQLEEAKAELQRVKQSRLRCRSVNLGSIGAVFRKIRYDKMLTQKEVASISGIHPVSVVQLEGSTCVNTKTLIRMAKGLGVRPSEILAEWEAQQEQLKGGQS